MHRKSRSRSITAKEAIKFPPVHPGELRKETIGDFGLTMSQLAPAIRVPANRINSIVAGTRSITGETALRLAPYFDTTPEYWPNLQSRYDLETARHQWECGVTSEIQPRSAA